MSEKYYKVFGGGCRKALVKDGKMDEYPHDFNKAIECDRPGFHPHLPPLGFTWNPWNPEQKVPLETDNIDNDADEYNRTRTKLPTLVAERGQRSN